MIDLSKQPVYQVSKEYRLRHNRLKPKARTRGAISSSVRKALRERSNGLCERPGCKNEAIHAAHIQRRWKLSKTTVDDLLHLCLACHMWADQTAEGRAYLSALADSVESKQ